MLGLFYPILVGAAKVFPEHFAGIWLQMRVGAVYEVKHSIWEE
jgi:hypothetical protein